MLLLYRITFAFCIPPGVIYIPLCFYFIHIIILLFLSSRLSTFHYASTLSKQALNEAHDYY